MNDELLVSDAAHFRVEYEINPYMRTEVQPDLAAAIIEHEAIVAAHLTAGRTVEYLPSAPECPDMVFVANAALVRNGRAVLGSPPLERKPEIPYFQEWLTGHGYEIIEAPYAFGGQGDALAFGDLLLMGYGHRTDRRMHAILARELGYEVVPLRTISPRWFDLDLAVAVIGSQTLAFCPRALDARSRRSVRGLGADLIEVSEDEAARFALNLISDGTTVTMPRGVPQLAGALRERGLQVVELNTTELAKGGGAVHCTALTLGSPRALHSTRTRSSYERRRRMHIAYTPAQERLRQEVRAYFATLMTPELRQALAEDAGDYGDGTAYRQVVRQLGKDGWLALSWPAEYGGRDGDMMDQLIFTDEAAIAQVPVPFLTINTVGPTIMRFGTPQQRQQYLPRISAGEIHFSIGYSEPEAGTDLASLRTRAIRDGDEYVINGQKMWTSLIQYADYVWLACRTDPDLPRHKGLSILIVPTGAPGFSWTPVPTLAGPVTSATYFQDVRVPVTALVGEQNKGWPLITNQLNHERVALTSAAPLRATLADVTEWARATKLPDGQRVIDQEWVQLNLARVHAKAEFLKLVNWRIASSSEHLGPAAASATKVFGTEFAIEAYRLLMDVLGANANVREGSPGAVLAGRVERMHRAALILTFGGGTNEVQRDIIAATALSLPIPPRYTP